MNMENKNPTMKKIIVANNIFIVLQMILLSLSVVLNFICDDSKVFLAVFVHVGLFVVYNIVVENIVDYVYIRKKYEKICHNTNSLRYLQLKKRIYQSAKSKQDKITITLMIQTFVKIIIVIVNIIIMIFMINFE